ncbi:MAG: STAS domain-containing protein [Pirellulaceae bacterium]
MKMTVAASDGELVRVALSGPVTQRELAPMSEPLQDLLGPSAYSKRVMLDLNEVSYLDSSGVGWLLSCHKKMRQGGGRMVVHSYSPIVSNVFRVLKLERVLDLAENAMAAEKTALEASA